MSRASDHPHDLVTGATGMLGSHIAQKLVEHGREVWALVRPAATPGSFNRLAWPSSKAT